MGILDFFRRTTAAPTVGTSNVDPSSATDSTAPHGADLGEPRTGSTMVSSLVEQSDVGSSEADEASSKAPSAPPAWSLLAPIGTVAQRSMHPSFDTGVATKLRTLRGPNDVFVSSALSHTVNRKASGIVDGLLTPSAAPLGFAAWQTDSQQVLRRQHPTAAELPVLDVAHSRWPILSRVAAERAYLAPSLVSPPTDFSASIPAAQGAVRSENEGFALSDARDNLVHRSEAEELGPFAEDQSNSEPLEGSGDASAEPFRSTIGRSLPLVSAEAGLLRTTLPKPETTMAAFVAPVINRKPASSVGEPNGPQAAPIPLVSATSSRPTLSSPSTVMSDPIVDPAGFSESGVEPASLQRSVGEFTSLRRRSIIEMPSSSSIAAGNDYSATITPRPVESFDPQASSPNFQSTIDRTPESVSSGELALPASDPPASQPTLGRKAGLGEPLSAIPASALVALREEPSSNPFAGWNDETSDMTLARTTDADPSSFVPSPGSPEVVSSPPLPNSGSTLMRLEDESRSTFGSVSTQATSVSPGSYLRVVSETPPVEHSVPEAQSPAPSPVQADRPLLGDQSILHRSTDELTAEGLLASSVVLHENSRAPIAVPVQRMSAAPNGTSAIGPANMQRKHSNVEMVSTQSTEGGSSDSFAGIAPRQLQRVPDSDASASLPNGGSDQPHLIPPGSAPVISRSDIGPIHRVPLARLAASDASPFLSPVSQQSGFANSALGKQQHTFQSGGESRASWGSIEPTSGKLALLDRAVDRNGPSLTSTWGNASGFMQRDFGSTINEATTKVMENGSKYPNQNDTWPAPTTADETYKSSTPVKEHSMPPSQNEVSPKSPVDSAPPDVPSEAPAGAATTGATATGSSAQAETDVEMLAGRIYDRIRNRLRRELLDDRERAGLTLDRVR
jgi:hypothetical protein